MSNMVTRCPQCQTSFKVTDEHLKIANGAVRCGACLHVFQARLHWVEPTATPTPPAGSEPAAARPVVTPSPVTPAEKPAAATAPSTTAPSTTAPSTTAPSTTTPSTTPSAKAGKFAFDQSSIDNSSAGQLLGEPDKRIPETALTRAHAEPQKKIDELGDEDLISDDLGLEDDEPDLAAAKRLADEAAFGELEDDDYSALFDEVTEQQSDDSDDFDALLRGEFNDVDELSENAPDESGTGTADEAWAKELLDELREEEKPAEIDLSEVQDVRKVLIDFTNPVDADAARRDLGLPESSGPFATRELTGGKPVPAARAEMIAHIEPAPVELAPSRHHETGWKNRLVWSGVALLLLLSLLAQHVFFRFDQLAQQEATRPLLLGLCHVAGCEVPAMQTWRHIRISSLLVRQHPTAVNALAVDAILLNTTSGALPFPPLELYFNSMEQLPVASRRFAPAEYLAGEMSGKTDIPPGRPVHIAFEIIKPGDAAVNWNLQVARRQ